MGILVIAIVILIIFLLLHVVAKEAIPTISSIISPLGANLVSDVLIIGFN
jgi:hypothetical protein